MNTLPSDWCAPAQKERMNRTFPIQPQVLPIVHPPPTLEKMKKIKDPIWGSSERVHNALERQVSSQGVKMVPLASACAQQATPGKRD